MIHNGLIGLIAERYGLPTFLVEAIIDQESSGNPWAIRFEPAFHRTYVLNKPYETFWPCSTKTEGEARATSWGLMQVMGQTARELGFTGPFLSELCDPSVGIDLGCRYLAELAERFPGPKYGWDAVCAAYNGGPGAVQSSVLFKNPEYPEKIRERLGYNWPQR
jgi:soluble lytic murein transglycosylase-like protein